MLAGRKKAKLLALSLILLLAMAIQTQTGCGDESPPRPEQEHAMPAKELSGRALNLFGGTTPANEFPYSSVSGISLSRMLESGGGDKGLFLLDTRTKADYDQGHISGSTQVEFGQWAAPENLAKYPRDKKIVVIDYLDDYGGEIVGGLRMLGYDAVSLRGGIHGWAQGFMQAEIMRELSKTDYPVDTTPAEPLAVASGGAFEAPSETDFKMLAEKANGVFNGRKAGDNAVTAEELYRLIQAEEEARPFVLDIRQRADFDQGHIPGAANIPFQSLGTMENLEKLPQDRKIVVVCAYGSMTGQVVTVLRMLGHDVVHLKHSMMSWNGSGKNTFMEYLQAANNPVVASP